MTNELAVYDLNLKTITVVINSLQLTITVIGLIWAYYRFRKESTLHPRIEFSVDCKFYEPQENSVLTAITISAHNKGNIEHKFREIKIRILGIRHGAKLAIKTFENGEYPPMTAFPEPCLDELDIVPKSFRDNVDEYYFVRPNVNQTFNYVTHIQSDIRFVIVKASFRYEGKIAETHTAERVFEVRSEP